MIPLLVCVTATPFLRLPAAAAAGTAGGISSFTAQSLIKSDGKYDYTGQASPWDAALAKRVQGLSNIRAVSANGTTNLAIDGAGIPIGPRHTNSRRSSCSPDCGT